MPSGYNLPVIFKEKQRCLKTVDAVQQFRNKVPKVVVLQGMYAYVCIPFVDLDALSETRPHTRASTSSWPPFYWLNDNTILLTTLLRTILLPRSNTQTTNNRGKYRSTVPARL